MHPRMLRATSDVSSGAKFDLGVIDSSLPMTWAQTAHPACCGGRGVVQVAASQETSSNVRSV